jgi:outer membrane murein-binding lipoprotein Lpp
MKIKYKFLILSAVVLTIAGCVPKSDYEKLKTENGELAAKLKLLNMELSLIETENQNFKEEQRKVEEKKMIAARHTEEEALRLLKDYYDFYDGDNVYRNPRARRTSDNSFTISLEECTKKFSHQEFFWKSRVRKLTIYENGKYDII